MLRLCTLLSRCELGCCCLLSNPHTDTSSALLWTVQGWHQAAPADQCVVVATLQLMPALMQCCSCTAQQSVTGQYGSHPNILDSHTARPTTSVTLCIMFVSSTC